MTYNSRSVDVMILAAGVIMVLLRNICAKIAFAINEWFGLKSATMIQLKIGFTVAGTMAAILSLLSLFGINW
jgi:hypothetical protein